MNKKLQVKKLYDKYGDKICLAPFLNNFYTTSHIVGKDQTAINQIKPCTVIKSNNEWNIQNSSISDSRNNIHWKNLRSAMLNGQLDQLHGCRDCSGAEKLGASSSRQLNNEYLFEHLDLDIMAEIEKIINNGLTVDSVHALDYMPSNYCNYACVMCIAGASSQRHVFEIKNGAKTKNVTNPVESDFFDLLKDVKILGFTGGETILQPEVHKVIDQIIEKDLAKNMIITMLTNASDFPDEMVEKFKHFKKVLYTVSIDGIGEIIEYQRRGADWNTVEKNTIKIHQTPVVHEIVNHVVSAINILHAMDFVDWCHANDMKFIAISPVYQQNTLGVAALPPELRTVALERLKNGRKRYEHYRTGYTNHEKNWLDTIDRLISSVENVEFSPDALQKFIKHIELEDMFSKRPLREVVPEWAPWFVN